VQRVGLAVAVLALALAAAGCGGSSGKSARRTAVASYIVRIDTVEQQLRVPLTKVEKAYREFGTKKEPAKATAARLAGAEATLHTLKTRVSLIPAPPDARKLRLLMVRLTGAEVELAHELSTLSVFLPVFVRALQPLGAANTTLKTSLAAIKVPTPKSVPPSKLKAARAEYTRQVDAAALAQADALDAYLATIAKVQASLRGLDPPPALTPSYEEQAKTLAKVRTTGATLVAALRAKDFKHVAARNRAFQAAAQTSSSVTAQKAQIAAIKAYNARVLAIGALAREVDNERSAVQKRLG
jgi:hypothetical protein